MLCKHLYEQKNLNKMKKQILMGIALLLITGMVSAQQNASTVVLASNATTNSKEVKKLPVFSWEHQTYDFAEIPQGKPVTTTFNYTNNGEIPLIISDVKTSCGCTVADYTKEAVLPGKTGYVKVTYSAASQGAFNKAVTVTANTETGSQVLFIKGKVQ